MASISTDKSGNRRILYFDENRKRRVLYIGKVSERDAEGVQRRVESMLAARILGNAIDRDDARWLSESPMIREKLERLDLIPSGKIQIDRRCMSMEEFLDDYIERHGASRKPATVAVWKQVVANLKEFMPEGIRINQITAGHAKEFHEKLKARGMATTTIHKRIQFARQFMHDAVDWKIIDENPFCKVKTQKSSVKVNEFVPREVVDKLMKKANPVWQVILGLSRYGGLRTPSETLSLR
jgi:hypothetical protein